MSPYDKNFGKNLNLGILLLRVALGGLMLVHGINKMIHGIDFIQNTVAAAGLPTFIAYGVFVGEVLVPILLIAGVATRAASLIFSFNMLVATLLVHPASFFSLTEVGGWALELQGLYFFGGLVLFFTGGGKYALSRRFCWD